MGAWGYKALESDDGLDVIDFLRVHISKSTDWKMSEIITAMRANGFFGETFEDIAYYYDNSAMALAELYITFNDDGKLHYRDENAPDGLAFGKLRSFTADTESLRFLLRYLTDIRDEVPDKDGMRESADLWQEYESYGAWKAHVLSLFDRLQQAIENA